MKKKWLFYCGTALLLCSTSLQAAVTAASSNCLSNNPYHLLVNKQHSISASYIPAELVKPNVSFQSPGNIEKNYMEKEAARALEEMFAAAKNQGIRLVAVSGYRSYARQSVLYKNATASLGPDQKGTARPGQSEHQTGLAMDLNSISQSFQYSKEGKWLAQNAHLYGFIIRYPKDKTAVTGYIYEPWHVRYVGKELARQCFTSGLTLEEITHCCQPYKEVTMNIATFKAADDQAYSLLQINGNTYIKARDLIALIDGSLSLQGSLLHLTANGLLLSITDKASSATLNGSSVQLTSEPMLIEHTYYVPMRNVLSLLGYQLDFIDPSTLFIGQS